MLEENIKIEQKEGVEYPPIPKDIYQAELLDITSQKRPTFDTRLRPEREQIMETVFSFQFVILEGKDGEKDLRCRNTWANFVPNYLYISKKTGKNMLYRVIEGLQGKELTTKQIAEGLTSQMLNGLIGKQCRISVEPKTKGEKSFDKITDIYKANSQIKPLDAEEKEKCRVKPKDTTTDPNNAPQASGVLETDLEKAGEPYIPGGVIVENIPF